MCGKTVKKDNDDGADDWRAEEGGMAGRRQRETLIDAQRQELELVARSLGWGRATALSERKPSVVVAERRRVTRSEQGVKPARGQGRAWIR